MASPCIIAKKRSLDRTDASMHPGTDGLIAGPTLRQPGDHNLQPQRHLSQTTGPAVKAHGFASPSFDGFALSRMKGVFDPGKTQELAPMNLPPNPTGSVCTSQP